MVVQFASMFAMHPPAIATTEVQQSHATYLDGSSVLALSSDGCQVPLKYLDVEPLLQEAHSKNKPSNTSSSDQDLWPLPLLLVAHGV